MKKKVFFLMLAIIAMVASLSLNSCSKVDDALENAAIGEDYYIQLTSVETNLMNPETGESLSKELKNEWISANKGDSAGKVSMGKLSYDNAIKAFDANIKALTSQFNSLYAEKNILPEGGYIVYNYSLVTKSSTYKSASIRITNSGATSN